jgi:hypothetical protein
MFSFASILSSLCHGGRYLQESVAESATDLSGGFHPHAPVDEANADEAVWAPAEGAGPAYPEVRFICNIIMMK